MAIYHLLATAACVLATCLCAIFVKRFGLFKKFGVPYAKGYPVFGSMFDLVAQRKHLFEMVQRFYQLDPIAKYVGAFDLGLFGWPIVVLKDLELIKSVAIKNFDLFSDRHPFMKVDVDPLFANNLFSLQGEKWREARNLLSPAFTSSKMRAMFESMVNCSKNFVDHCARLEVEERSDMPIKNLFNKFTNDVIATCAFGVDVDSLNDPDNQFYRFGKEAADFKKFISWQCFVASFFPKTARLFNLKFVSDRVGTFFVRLVSDIISSRSTKGTSRTDMIQLMINAKGSDKSKHLKLDITEITSQAFLFFLGGFESTSTQMCVIAHELAINPAIQAKLQEEIDRVLEQSKGGEPTYEAVNSMAYLDAVFNESLRKYTQFTFLERLCSKSFELPPALPGREPFVVKPGMKIWIPSSAIHKDPIYFDKPEIFDPERYYEKKASTNDSVNLGFGIGPRGCIGSRFATLEIKILFFFVLAKFSFRASERTPRPFVYDSKTVSTSPVGGYWLTMETRKL